MGATHKKHVAEKLVAVTLLDGVQRVSSSNSSVSSTFGSVDTTCLTLNSRTLSPTVLAAATSSDALITELRGWSMLLWPEHTQTSPNTTPVSESEPPLAPLAVTVYEPLVVGGCGGRDAFQTPFVSA